MRETILANGGEIHFNARVSDFVLKNEQVQAVITS